MSMPNTIPDAKSNTNFIIKKAILPIAGLGTRFLPVTKVIPKEMLPINGKPIVQILVEEAAQCGIDEIIFIINKEKEPMIRDYFSRETPTSKKIAEKGKTENLTKLNDLLHKIKFHYVIQEQQHGDGHAILQAEKYINEGEPFVVLFGDDIVTQKNAINEMITAFNENKSCTIALEEIPLEKVENYGIIKPKNSKGPLYEIENLVEKPKEEIAPSNLGIIGKYILLPEIFAALKRCGEERNHSRDGEIRLIDGFKELLKTQKIFGLKISGHRYDTGTLEGYRKAISEIQ